MHILIKFLNKYCLEGIQAITLNMFTMEERQVNVNSYFDSYRMNNEYSIVF